MSRRFFILLGILLATSWPAISSAITIGDQTVDSNDRTAVDQILERAPQEELEQALASGRRQLGSGLQEMTARGGDWGIDDWAGFHQNQYGQARDLIDIRHALERRFYGDRSAERTRIEQDWQAIGHAGRWNGQDIRQSPHPGYGSNATLVQETAQRAANQTISELQTGGNFNPGTTPPNQTPTASLHVPECSAVYHVGCQILRVIANAFTEFLIPVGGWVLGFVQQGFDFVVQHTIVNFGEATSYVSDVWVISRNLVNIALIFVLLYASISIILNLPSFNAKRVVTRVIVVALLVNFSAFITRDVVIRVGNIVSQQLYTQGVKDLPAKTSANPRLLNNLNAQTTGLDPAKAMWGVVIPAGLAMVIFYAIAIVVMGAAVIMLVVRFITLLVLIAVAPLAFLAWAIPAWYEYAVWWGKKLFSQTFNAPLIFLLMALSTAVLNTDFTRQITGGASAGSGVAALLGTTIFFVVANGLMVASLILGSKLGAAGASGAMGLLTSAGRGAAGGATFGALGWAGRNTIGRWANKALESSALRERIAKGGVAGWIGRQQLKTYQTLEKSNFDARKTETAKRLGITKVFGEGPGKDSPAAKGYAAQVKAYAEGEKKLSGFVTQKTPADTAAVATAESNVTAQKAKIEEKRRELARLEERATNPATPKAAANMSMNLAAAKRDLDQMEKVELTQLQSAIQAAKDLPKQRGETMADNIQKPPIISNRRILFIGKTRRRAQKAASAIRGEVKKDPKEKDHEKLVKLLEDATKKEGATT